MAFKNSFAVLNRYPSLYFYPLLCAVVMLLLIWHFPYIPLFKLIVHECLTFIPTVVKIIFSIALFYLSVHFLIALFGAAMVAASVERIEQRSRSLFDGFSLVFKSFKFICAWILFDLVVYPIVNLITSKMSESPSATGAGGSMLDLAYWKVREFAVPIVVYEHLMPHKAFEKAMELTIKKGLASTLGDLGWEFLLIVLMFMGFGLPFLFKYSFGVQEFSAFWFSLEISYFIFVWIYFVLNKAIRIAQIYCSTQE